MNILKESFDFLSRNNYRPQNVGNSIIRFTSSGVNCLLFWDDDDEKFLKIDARFDLKQFDNSIDAMLRKCNKINKERKIIKAHIDYDDNLLILSTQILLDITPEIESLLERLITMISQATIVLSLI